MSCSGGTGSERGSGSVLMVGVMLVLTTLGAAGMWTAGYLAAGQRVRAAADLAALSGATATAAGRNGCSEAGRVAALNGADLVHCEVAGDSTRFVVAVETRMAVQLRLPGLPSAVGATAHAGPAHTLPAHVGPQR
jgi:secretion/DNA translocation related TadE-like protein